MNKIHNTAGLYSKSVCTQNTNAKWKRKYRISLMKNDGQSQEKHLFNAFSPDNNIVSIPIAEEIDRQA